MRAQDLSCAGRRAPASPSVPTSFMWCVSMSVCHAAAHWLPRLSLGSIDCVSAYVYTYLCEHVPARLYAHSLNVCTLVLMYARAHLHAWTHTRTHTHARAHTHTCTYGMDTHMRAHIELSPTLHTLLFHTHRERNVPTKVVRGPGQAARAAAQAL